MYRAVLASLVLLLISGMVSRVEARVIPYRKLTLEQQMALDESERRMGIYDRALQALDRERKHGRISRGEYGYESHDLTAYIAAEARFQNDIMISDQPFPPDSVQEVMANIVKYGVVMPAEVIGSIAIRCAPMLNGLRL